MIDCFWVVMSVVTEVALTGTGLWVGEEHMHGMGTLGSTYQNPMGPLDLKSKQPILMSKC